MPCLVPCCQSDAGLDSCAGLSGWRCWRLPCCVRLQRACAWPTTRRRTCCTGGSTVMSTSTASRRRRLREAIDRWFAWHRRTQLPDYAALLARAQREVSSRPRRRRPVRWAGRGRAARSTSALEAAAPAAAELMLTLTPEQLQHIERRMAKAQRRDARRLPAGRPGRARGPSRSSARWSASRCFTAGSTPRSASGWRRCWPLRPSTPSAGWPSGARASATCCRAWPAPARPSRQRADRNEALQQAQAAARLIVERSERSPRADYRAYQQRLTQDNCAARRHHAQRDEPAQRAGGTRQIEGLGRRSAHLIAAQTASSGSGVVSR